MPGDEPIRDSCPTASLRDCLHHPNRTTLDSHHPGRETEHLLSSAALESVQPTGRLMPDVSHRAASSSRNENLFPWFQPE